IAGSSATPPSYHAPAIAPKPVATDTALDSTPRIARYWHSARTTVFAIRRYALAVVDSRREIRAVRARARSRSTRCATWARRLARSQAKSLVERGGAVAGDHWSS